MVIFNFFKKLAWNFLGFFLLALILAGSIQAIEPVIGVEYLLNPSGIRILEGAEYTSAEKGTVAWDCVPEAIYYEVKIVWLDPTIPIEYALGQVTQCQIEVLKPRTGHFKAMVRACKTPDLCSDWADSTNKEYASVNGISCGWWIFWKQAPPSQVIIEPVP